ncbi:DUF3888 domain-containing protein [Tumebacillus flagellatus]|uniref:DUF3888 domain-containing protein n=1 Tax=Tumebacillus flagellatus TaxID=1157490 RepID=A0A074LTN4_9BACL|nr:DUF3888 domain-containing protein [Tumebacillus flagellatus]KEO84474.1 hypothetical protein EL26_05080 [Tumebacillus flagellatus]
MKKRLATYATLALAVLTLTAAFPATGLQAVTRETREQLMEDAMLTALSAPLHQAVQEHYKTNPPRFAIRDAQVLHLTHDAHDPATYTVRVQLRMLDDATQQAKSRDIVTVRVQPGASKVLGYETYPVEARNHA